MPYSELAQYLTWRRGVQNPVETQKFTLAINALFLALEEGNTVQETPAHDLQNLRQYALLGDPNHLDTPLVAEDNFLWLNRIYHWEKALAEAIRTRIARPLTNPPPLDDDTTLNAEQKNAIQLALRQRFSIINGGPGTGKTYTVSHIVRAILQHNPDTKIAFAAPTGKAAKRMDESLKKNPLLQPFWPQLPDAQTLHRLLGLRRGTTPFYGHEQPLPVDLLIIDEASMLSLELAHALFAACPPDARLILLGDADQLAAVDAGAVLHDLSIHPVLQPFIATLTTMHRFHRDSGIGELAQALRQRTAIPDIRTFLRAKPEIDWQENPSPDLYQRLFAPYQSFVEAIKNHAPPATCFAAFEQYCILSAGHAGNFGVESINQALSQLHLQALQQPTGQNAYDGMPLLITANNYDLGLFNGDIGLCFQEKWGAQVYFPERADPVPLSALSPLQRTLAYALTVHKSQGSEYPHIAFLLDEKQERLLTRELLYTGLTRAKEKIDLYASAVTLQQAVTSATKRHTGLAELL